jgi:hypothetical protein
MTDTTIQRARASTRPGPLRAALAVITVAALVRLVVAAVIPLPPDETYYWEWSRRLASGYFDHPPAIALLIRAGVALLGVTPAGIRLGAVLTGWGASLCVVLLARRLAGDGAALRAAVIITCMPLAAAGLLLATPDAPLLLGVAASLLALDHAVAAPPGSAVSRRWWLAAGLALGVALASKYNAALLPLAVLLALAAVAPLRRHLATPAPYLAVLVALAIMAPVIAWNGRHDWASFLFQIHHGLGGRGGNPLNREASLLASQLALVSPILFVLLAIAVARAMGSRTLSPRERLLAIVAATMFLFFCVTALRQRAEANWQAPAYVGAIALLAAHTRTQTWRRWLGAACALGATMGTLVYIQAASPFLPIGVADDPTARGAGWNTLAQHMTSVAARLGETTGGRIWFGGDRYQEASELAFHLPEHPTTISLNLGGRPNQYDYWPTFPQRARVGDNLVVALDPADGGRPDSVVPLLAPYFARVWRAQAVGLRRGQALRMKRVIWVFEGWRGTWPHRARSSLAVRASF